METLLKIESFPQCEHQLENIQLKKYTDCDISINIPIPI